MKLADIDNYLLEDIESSDHPSDFIKRDNYACIILRLPIKNGNNIDIISYSFLIEKDKVYTYNKESKTIELFGTLNDMQKSLESKIEKLIKDIKEYHIKIDHLEELLYEDELNSDFMEQWLKYKKDISLINRLMFHASIVMELFIAYLKKEHKDEYNFAAFEDLYEEITRVRNLANSAIEKLNNLYDFYRAKVDEKMNKNVYYLTLLSGIFLPLTLVTGFFGMNTGGLPFTEDNYGTWKVVAVSIVLEIIFFLPFIYLNSKSSKK